MRDVGSWIVNAIFPRFCVSCEAEGDVLCRACHARWRPVAPMVYDRTFSFFSYADPIIQKLLHAWKYEYDLRAWHFLRKEMEERMTYLQVWVQRVQADVLVPVPLYYVKRNERGFDQAEELAHVFSALCNIPVARMLVRYRSTKPQAHKTKEERLMSYMRNPFMRRSRIPVSPKHRVLLVDDVFTTGSTMIATEMALSEEVVGYVVMATGGQ